MLAVPVGPVRSAALALLPVRPSLLSTLVGAAVLLGLGRSCAVAQDPAQKTPAAAPGIGAVPIETAVPRLANQVERHGITWHFAAEVSVGTFVNGDPWVLGPVRIVHIDPPSIEVEGRVMHGSMVDPDPTSMLQGYDSCLFGDEKRERYRSERNVAFGISADRPLVLAAPASLVSVQSRLDRTLMPQLETAAVLTVLAAPPPADAFRPPYGRGDKTVAHRAAELDFTVLRQLAGLAGAPPIDTVAAGFERLWLDHFPEWPVRYAHPAANMPDYGREMAAAVGSGGLLLNGDLPDAKKRLLLVRMVQLGIDSHGLLRGGGRWPGLGGHGSGRKFPILLAGLVLHDAKMLAIGAEFVSQRRTADAGEQFFAEDGQTFYVRETAPGVWNWGHGGYTKDHDGLPEWGFNHADQLTTDRAAWDDNPYRRCCSANGWVGQALAARLLGLQEAWGHPAFFDYMDRYMQVKPTEGWHRAWVAWHASMWDAYRGAY